MHILKIKTPKRKLGDLGERVARRYLFFRGYRILDTNYTTKDAEIDIVAIKDNTICFIEVKTRTVREDSNYPRPAAAVTAEKQRKIITASREYMEENYISNTRISFDVIEVYTERGRLSTKVKKINHIKSAFDKSVFKKRQNSKITK